MWRSKHTMHTAIPWNANSPSWKSEAPAFSRQRQILAEPSQQGEGNPEPACFVGLWSAVVLARSHGLDERGTRPISSRPSCPDDRLRGTAFNGPVGHEPLIKGTDLVARDGDRIESVVGFLDQVPAGA